MKRLIAAGCFLIAGLVFAGELAPNEKRSLQMSLDDTFVVESNDQWIVDVGEVLPLRYANVTVRPREGDAVVLELRFHCDTPDLAKFDTPEKLRRGLAFVSRQYLPQSVEQKVNLREELRKGRYNCYTDLTDASLADKKELEPREWRYMRVGMLRLTDDSALGYCICYKDEKAKAFLDTLEYIDQFITAGPSTAPATSTSK